MSTTKNGIHIMIAASVPGPPIGTAVSEYRNTNVARTAYSSAPNQTWLRIKGIAQVWLRELQSPSLSLGFIKRLHSTNVTDHGAATIDFPFQNRPTSPLPCIGLFADLIVWLSRSVPTDYAKFLCIIVHSLAQCGKVTARHPGGRWISRLVIETAASAVDNGDA